MQMHSGFLAQGVRFELTWVAPNGFQDRLVMTASITLRVDLPCNYTTASLVCQELFSQNRIRAVWSESAMQIHCSRRIK